MKKVLIVLLLFVAGSLQAQTPDSVFILKSKGSLQPITTFNFNQPLFILNGKKFSGDSLNIINPNSIASIHVYKGLDAKEKYGEEAKNGVVVIELKSPAKKEED